MGVILYASSQAEDVVGNCMAPVTEISIFACVCVSLSDGVLSMVTWGINVWQTVELTSLAQENMKSDTDCWVAWVALHRKMSFCVCGTISFCGLS